MLKVLKNLKYSLVSVIAIVILLCIQASTDLALPDYTSKIVNKGIQAGGIESAVPEVISKEDMDSLLIFTEQNNEILDNYTLVGETQNTREEKVIKKYLGEDYQVNKDTLYVLKEIDKKEEENLSKIMSGPLMELTTITSEETSNKIKEQMVQNVAKTIYSKHECNRYYQTNANRTKRTIFVRIH